MKCKWIKEVSIAILDTPAIVCMMFIFASLISKFAPSANGEFATLAETAPFAALCVAAFLMNLIFDQVRKVKRQSFVAEICKSTFLMAVAGCILIFV